VTSKVTVTPLYRRSDYTSRSTFTGTLTFAFKFTFDSPDTLIISPLRVSMGRGPGGPLASESPAWQPGESQSSVAIDNPPRAPGTPAGGGPAAQAGTRSLSDSTVNASDRLVTASRRRHGVTGLHMTRIFRRTVTVLVSTVRSTVAPRHDSERSGPARGRRMPACQCRLRIPASLPVSSARPTRTRESRSRARRTRKPRPGSRLHSSHCDCLCNGPGQSAPRVPRCHWLRPLRRRPLAGPGHDSADDSDEPSSWLCIGSRLSESIVAHGLAVGMPQLGRFSAGRPRGLLKGRGRGDEIRSMCHQT
jgi:hypothetical protein